MTCSRTRPRTRDTAVAAMMSAAIEASLRVVPLPMDLR